MLAIQYRDEPVRLEPDTLQRMVDDLGGGGADDVVCGAMEALAERLADLPALHQAGRLSEIDRLALGMIPLAHRIGLGSLAKAAEHVSDCARRGDPNALAATVGRLQRLGARSLSIVWDLRDQSL